MKPWQILFRMAPRDSAQGGSTGDDDFANEAEDDALAAEGEQELEEEVEEEEGDGEDEEESDEESDDDQSDEDQDDEGDEEEGDESEDEQEEEDPAKRFKDPKSGDFDFKRINKVLGGDFLEKRIKEQDATITKNFQELKSYKDLGAAPEKLVEFSRKAQFLDNLVDTNPLVQAEVLKALGIQPQGGGRAPAAGNAIPPGVNPDDPLLPVLLELKQNFDSINNRHLVEQRTRQQQEREAKFQTAFGGAKARFKELSGRDVTPEMAATLEQEMRQSGYLNPNIVQALFSQEIQAAMTAAAQKKILQKRVQKKNLPKVPAQRRVAPKARRQRSREDDREELWDKHMGDGGDD